MTNVSVGHQTAPAIESINSRDEAEASLAIYAAAQIQITHHLARKQKIELLAQRRDAKIRELRDRQQLQAARLQPWLKLERKRLSLVDVGYFQVELRHGLLKFRPLPPAVALLTEKATGPENKWTDKLSLAAMGFTDRFLAKLLLLLPQRWRDFIRVKPEINRQAIATAIRSGKLKPEALEKVGLHWDTGGESFSIELKLSK